MSHTKAELQVQYHDACTTAHVHPILRTRQALIGHACRQTGPCQTNKQGGPCVSCPVFQGTLDAAVFLKLPLHALAEISKAGCSSTRPCNWNQEDATEKKTCLKTHLHSSGAPGTLRRPPNLRGTFLRSSGARNQETRQQHETKQTKRT